MARRGLWLALCGLLVSGCVRRTLAIRSDPPGAEVWLNDHRVGTTPYKQDLEWYGWYRVSLMKPGYERIDDQVEIRAPLYLWIPLDLAMELVPLQVKDPNQLVYRMIPAAKPEDPIPAGFREAHGIDSAALEAEARSSAVTIPTSNGAGPIVDSTSQPSAPAAAQPAQETPPGEGDTP